MSNFAPVVLFVYSRPLHTTKLLETLNNCEFAYESDLFIYSDSPKKKSDISKVTEVRSIINEFKKVSKFKKTIIKQSNVNKGLAKSVIEGVNEIIDIYNKVIVLEDDLEVSKDFLTFMNDCLEFYKNNKSVWSVTGYSNIDIKKEKLFKEDMYLSLRASSWGWATWKDRWFLTDWNVNDYNLFEFNLIERWKFNLGGRDMSAMLDAQIDGRIDSWAIRWCYSQFKNKSYTVCPKLSKIKNNGLDGSGTHKVNQKITVLETSEVYIKPKKLKLDYFVLWNLRRKYNKYNKLPILSFYRHLVSKKIR